MTDLATFTELHAATGFEDIAHELTPAEQMFLYQLEVVGMSVVRAAEVSGVKSPYPLLKKAYMIAAREQYRAAVQGRTDFTREDIVHGLKQAIDQASVLGDPMAQIAGWREIAKLKGFDKQTSVHIQLTGTVEQVTKQVKSMSTARLIELAGHEALDGDFYRVGDGAAD